MPRSALFGHVRAVSPYVLVAFVLGHVALKAVFFSMPFYRFVAAPVNHATAGVITPIVLAALVQLVVLVGGVMVLMGRLNARDLGLERQAFVNAGVVMLLVWGLAQVATVLLGWSGLAPFAPNPDLATLPLPFLVGKQLDAIVGSAFIEEVMYRGFLMTQLVLLAQRRWPGRPGLSLGLGVGVTQLYFGINHIPAALRMHLPTAEIAMYIVHAALAGALFAALYLRTGNLFVAVGAHAIVNSPASLFVAGFDPALLALVPFATRKKPVVGAAAWLTALGAGAGAYWGASTGHHGGTLVYAYGVGTEKPVTQRDLTPEMDVAPGDLRLVHYHERVRPMFSRYCFSCHGSVDHPAAGLSLTTARAILAGGDSGPALVPGDADTSLLFQAISGTHPELTMPPGDRKPSVEDIEAVRRWINEGAVWSEQR